MSRTDQPRSFHFGDILLEDQAATFKIGAVIQPDETDPFKNVPFYFDKKIDWRRDLELGGVVTINGESFRDVGGWSAGTDPLEQLRGYLEKVPSAVGTLTLKVVDHPIVVVDKTRTDISRSPAIDYYPVPFSWFNVESEAGKSVFEEFVEFTTASYEVPGSFDKTRFDEDLWNRAEEFRFNAKESKITVWDSQKSLEENKATWLAATAEYGYRYSEEKFNSIVEGFNITA